MVKQAAQRAFVGNVHRLRGADGREHKREFRIFRRPRRGPGVLQRRGLRADTHGNRRKFRQRGDNLPERPPLAQRHVDGERRFRTIGFLQRHDVRAHVGIRRNFDRPRARERRKVLPLRLYGLSVRRAAVRAAERQRPNLQRGDNAVHACHAFPPVFWPGLT